MAKVRLNPKTKGVYQFWCPACNEIHQVWTSVEDGVAPWDYNYNMDKPTFSPSIKVEYHGADCETICHSFVRDGNIQFLTDCTHNFAGKMVELPNIEKYKDEY